MYYIISAKPLDYLKQFHIPYVGKTKTRDSEAFYSSTKGKKFLRITPLVISNCNDMRDAAHNIAIDIAYLSLCYNIPLYIYVLSDKSFYKELDIGCVSFRNFGKVAKLTDLHAKYNSYDFPEAKELKVDQQNTYYKGNIDEIIKVVAETLPKKKLTNYTCFSFKLTAKRGLKEIKERAVI